MSALFVFILLAAACSLAVLDDSGWRAPRRGRSNRNAAAHAGPEAAESLPRMVRQLASLLAAGRSGPLVWGALAQVLAMEQARSPAVGPVPLPRRAAINATVNDDSMPADAVLLLVLAVQQATSLGMPTATAVRNSCGEATAPVRGLQSRKHGWALTAEQHRMWFDVAACFEVCEGSGAPVAAILDRLALAIEAEQDASALRETALAGPRATVRLLSWLPFVGLGLGVIMGIDPIGALLGSPMGWTVLATGVAFSLAGRIWSARMIGGAARSPDIPQRRSAGASGRMRYIMLCRQR